MTWPACASEPASAPAGSGTWLTARPTGDGSFSLFSNHFQEGFHCAEGALAEAHRTFIGPAELERFAPHHPLVVVEVAVGTGTNTACLIEAAAHRGLRLRWWGLERDPEPLRLALADAGFRSQWEPAVVGELERLCRGPQVLWGDARLRLAELRQELLGCCDLVLLDAFSPRRCPQLWSLEFLSGLTGLLRPEGRLLTYSSAAAVRWSLERSGMDLATIQAPASGTPDGTAETTGRWSLGTVASPTPLAPSGRLRPLGSMEREHLATRASEPYRDPTGRAAAPAILAARDQAQAASGAESTSRWRRRWGVGRR